MFVYKITNKINGKLYVGMTKNSISSRWRDHCGLKNSGASLLILALKKYGKDSFEIEKIDEAISIEELKEKEIFWIKELKTQVPYGYNIQPGGIGGRNEKSVLVHEIPIRCIESGEEFRSITEASVKLNLIMSKIALVCKGKRDFTGGLSFEYLNLEKKLEANKKRKKRKNKQESTKRRSLSGKIGARKRFKRIKCVETGIIFDSIAEAARSMCLWRPNIVKNLQGKHKTVQGYTFVLI